MRILISHAYFLPLDTKEEQNGKPYPPLASLHMAALITKELGWEVHFFDVMFERDSHALAREVDRLNPDILLIYDDDFNYLTKMCLENMRSAITALPGLCKSRPRFLIHGSDPSDHPDLYLNAGYDYVIHRNAENATLSLLRKLAVGKPSMVELAEIASLSFSDNGNLRTTAMAKTNYPIENTPIPRWDLVDLEPYRKTWTGNHGYFSLNISTSHGCPFRCNWCAKPLYGRTYKSIPPARVAEEFALLKHEYGVQYLWVTDDIFALKPGWLTEFANEIEKRQAYIPYKIQSRADLVSEEYAAELARSGCDEVWMGVESGSQKILDAMDKDLKTEQTITATERLRAHGIKVAFFLQYGYPGEEQEDIRMTLELIRNAQPDRIGISVSYPLKGTSFYETVLRSMGEKQNWKDSGDLELMFAGKYPAGFYRALHRYTHHYFGMISVLRPQSIGRRMRRLAAQYRHVPGLLRAKRDMRNILRPDGEKLIL
jgi:anaerobic magnesium-protoporphyrin IX monomethyl ester cyclase